MPGAVVALEVAIAMRGDAYRVGVAKRRPVSGRERREAARLALQWIEADDPTGLGVELVVLGDGRFPFPADVFIELACAAFELAGVSRERPVSLADFRERYLSEWDIHGNTALQKSRRALDLVVGAYAGVVPDYDGDAGWWRVQDLGSYALLALVVAVRVGAERTGRPIATICAELASGLDVTS